MTPIKEDVYDRDYRKVKVIYTGGTIGMVRDKEGALVPLPREFANKMRKNPQLNDPTFKFRIFDQLDEASPLVLPATFGQKRIIYYIDEYDPLLDSSNMSMDDWKRIADDIYEAYENFDGFIVLHGTDTMPYTASALSFMLENLGKTVILTGSQIPIFETRNDGIENLISSLLLAGNYIIPEVSIYFNSKLFRGNRTVKIDSSSFLAFDTPNMTALADVGIDIEVHYRDIFRPNVIDKFQVQSKLNKNIGLLRIFPSINTETIKSFLRPPIQGVILQTYGAGNVPSNRTDLMTALKEATGRGVIIINITQCQKGSVADLYQTGHELATAGVILGYDMTPEAALTKLAYVLAKDEWNLDKKKLIMQSNIRGELTGLKPPYQQDFNLEDAVARTLHLLGPLPNELEQLDRVVFPAMMCAAVEERDHSKLIALKEYGANISGINCDMRTPLHIACSEGSEEIVKYLLQNGASIHMRDRYGQTPLQDAIDFDNHDVIILLRKCGAHLTGNTLQLGEKLCSAASFGRLERLKSYQLANVNLAQPDITGRTAMHAAVLAEQDTIVQFLLDNNVAIDKPDKLGATPLSIADTLNLKSIKDLWHKKLHDKHKDTKRLERRNSDFTTR